MPDPGNLKRHLAESPLHGIKLNVGIYSDRVIEELSDTGIEVMPSPLCAKIIHTNFRGSFRDLISFVPILSTYRVRQHRWWHRTKPD